MKIALFRGRGVISQLIRWQTRSVYSHLAIVLDDGTIVEAWQGHGVRRTTLKSIENVDFFDFPHSEDQAVEIERWLLDQVGKKYDYLGVMRFLSRRRHSENANWFCSELGFYALLRVGIALLERVQASAVSPGLCGFSPLLTRTSPPANLLARI